MNPGHLDPDVIRRHLMALRHTIETLARHRGSTVEELESDDDLRWAIERGLQLCAQNAIDLATHVAVASGRDVPDYGAALAALGETGALPHEFANRFRNIAGFRNVLVHGYLDVDVGIIVRLLNERLDDFAKFAAYIEKLLTEETGQDH